MTFQQLRYFLAAEVHGSFSAAADELHMAQPSLSDQVRRLEDELGVALFVRAGRRLTLTDAGRSLRPHAERVLATAAQAREAVAEVRELRGGTASFGTFNNAPFYLLSELIPDFRSRHPDVCLRVIGQNSAEVADAVRAGDLEAGIVSLPVEATGLDVRPVMRDELLYASHDRSRVRKPVTTKDLAAATLILYDARYWWSDPTRRLLRERAQRAGVTIEPAVEVEGLLVALDLAARGVGDTVVLTSMAAHPRFPSRLHTAAFAEPIGDVLAFVTRRDAHPSPATRELMALAERQIGEYQSGTRSAPGPARAGS